MVKSELTLALSIILSISLLMSSCTCQTVGNRVEIDRYGNVIPAANVTYDLGSITNWWNNGYIDNLYVGSITVNVTGGAGTGNITGGGTAGTIPEWTSTLNLGNSPITHLIGLINFNSHTLTNVVDPTNPQDAATKNYVDSTAGGTGNVTSGTGALNIGRMPYFTALKNIEQSVVFWDNGTNRMGINDDTPSYTLDVGGTAHVTGDVNSDSDINASNDLTAGNDLDIFDDADIGGDLDVVGATSSTRYTSTVAIGTAPFTVTSTTNVTNLNVDLLDGNHASAFALASAGTGNVTAAGMTAGYIPLATSTTGLTNSIISANSTNVEVNLILGAELAPAMTQADWTEGANWTINDGAGTATRVASAVTTLVPTVAIVPTIGSRYQVTFTISGWTAGQITVTLGGLVSTPLQGNQNVSLFFSPYTTDNLIFTPDANFAGVITLVSVKAMTGGYLTVDNDIYSYDSRGHLNRMGNMIRHLNEMATDTLLDKSRSTLTCAGGVLTYTLYAVYGQGTWNFNGVVYPGAVASANVTLTGGTDAVPKTNWVYFDLNGNTPRLAVSTTAEPTTTHIMVAEFIVGSVAGANYTIYGYNRARTEVDSFVKRVIGRFENSGSLYVDGSLPTVNSTVIQVAANGRWYQGIFEMTAANVVASNGYYFINGDGTYSYSTNLADMHHYGDAAMTVMGANERQNIVWGIVPTTTTASGTLPTTVKLFAVLQSKPSTVYISATTAEQDIYDATNYYPPDPQLKEMFVPIARTILRPSTPVFNAFGSGLYYRDLRGKTSYGGGSATSAPDLSGYLLIDGTRAMTGNLNMGTSGNITMSAGMTVDGVDISSLSFTSNVTGVGTSGKMTKWSGTSTITDATNTDTDVADAVTKKHTQGTDTALGALGTKNPPIDADKFIYRDSAAADALVTSTGTQVKAYLKTYFDGVYATLGGYLTNPMTNDSPLYFGSTNQTAFLYETADANANAMVIALPDGGATDVPVLVIGDQSVINKDLGRFNGFTSPMWAVMSADETAYISGRIIQGTTTGEIYTTNNLYIETPGIVRIRAGATPGTYNLKIDTASNIPTLYGTGAYLRVGDAATTSHSFASEDDLMVTGKLEVDGQGMFDDYLYATAGIVVDAATYNYIRTANDGRYIRLGARDTGVDVVEVARIAGAADPYFQIGRDDTGVALNAVTDMLVLQAGGGTGNVTTNFGLGISAKLDNAVSEVEERASVDFVLTDATNGSEDVVVDLNLMAAGAMGKIVTISPTGMSFTPAGYTVDGVDISAISAVSNPMPDDSPFSFGTGNTSSLLWETADANANALVLALPDGGATDVPVLVIGDQSVINKDLTFFNGITRPWIAILDADESYYARFGFYSAGVPAIKTNANTLEIQTNSATYKLTIAGDGGGSHVPTLYGTGAYLRIGDAATTSHSLASEDDLMVTGKLEVDGYAYFDSNNYFYGRLASNSGGIEINTSSWLQTTNTDSQSISVYTRDNGVGQCVSMRIVNADNPFIEIGRDDTGVALNTVTDMLVLRAGGGTGNAAAGFGLGIPVYLSNAASEQEERASIDFVLTTPTNGAEDSVIKFSTMNAGAMVANALTISANTTSVTLTPTGTLVFNGAVQYGADAGANDTYTCTIAGISAYVTGMPIYFKANTVNTGACSINVNALGAIALKINGGADDPADGWIKANEIVHCVYDGTNFQVINPDATP